MPRPITLLLCLALAACSSLAERQALGPRLAQKAGWQWRVLEGGAFRLAAATAPLAASPRLVVFLEGDGFAYVRPTQPSRNPTPSDPVALRLALAQPRGAPALNLAWLGRPCQYVSSPACRTADWTRRRYAPEILDSVNAALDQLKRQSGARTLVLVGYSGGGAIAALLAARRTDVAALITVVADLDLGYWTRRDGLSPLTGSLDPAEAAPALAALPQAHFAGGDDAVVGPDVTRAYLRRLPPGAPARLLVIPGFTHACCWSRDWPSLQRQVADLLRDSAVRPAAPRR
ncbi:alpha/beta hydrolase family protein [mine drainage metagenome]|uniref:Alpha/beta hydrolase family protein n=1 Tax=mine drainage metagenome TaxID=410659 RepID=A0A1J5S260_9ZZZZ